MGMVNSYDDLLAHVGHTVQCVEYGAGINVALECLDCNHVLVDYDRADVAEASREATEKPTVNVLLSMKGGLPHEGPFVTEDGGHANKAYVAYCKTLDLSTDNPHDGEGDVFWWTIKVGGEAQEVTPW